jgi:hypothetical protein
MKLAFGLHEDVPMEVYHGDCCEGPSVSASNLITMEQECPARAWWESYRNPDREDKDTPSLFFGRVLHTLLLEGQEVFDERYRIQPKDLSLSTKDGLAFKKECEKAGLEIVKQEIFEKARAMVRALQANPLAARALSDGRSEQTLIWKDEPTGLWLKARPDFLPKGMRAVPNYKTADSAKPDEFRKSAFNLGYHQAAALMLDGLKAVLDWDRPHHFWIAQEKTEPFVVTLCTMRDEDLQWGRLLNRRALDLWARCIERNEWPGYAEGVVQIGMEPWRDKALEERHAAGEFTQQEGPYEQAAE